MPVVLGPGWPGVLLHEAVGHGLEGDFNRKGTSAFSGRIGERVAAPGVTVIDDGAMDQRRGSLTIDDEGTPTRRNVLIEDGILKGYIQDRLNARLMGVEPTGNGRRESFAHAPMPRMTNTFMLGGKDDPGELVERVKDGIYAKSFGGGQVDITSGKFVFSCTEAYRIRGGKIAEPIKGATLIGDGPTVLTRVKGIGNDLALDEGIGICGKGGQSVPAGVGQPTLADRRPDGRRHRRVTAADWRSRRPQILVRARSRSNGGAAARSSITASRERFLKLWSEKRQLPVDAFLDDPLTALAGGHPVRPVPAQHVPRPRRPVRDRSSGAGDRQGGGRRGFRRSSWSRRNAASSTCRSSTARTSPTRTVACCCSPSSATRTSSDYARKHREIIERFGRFPHRNAILGRAPRPDEIAAGDVMPW